MAVQTLNSTLIESLNGLGQLALPNWLRKREMNFCWRMLHTLGNSDAVATLTKLN